MLNPNRRTLAVVGAGPKGLAIAVKAKVLEEFGLPVDQVVLIERHSVAAHWSGNAGYTNGELKLGTSPEKDVVFPLATEVGDPQLDQQIRQRLMDFTWTSYLAQTSQLSEWVDRGRPAPCHQKWANYLKWVAEQLAPQVSIVQGEVVQIDLAPHSSEWRLRLDSTQSDSNLRYLTADRLMLTGPGKTRMNFKHDSQVLSTPGFYDLESFWCTLRSKTFNPEGRIGIVGAGENAASILLALSKINPDLRVDVISPKGFISTRAENYYENRIYSQPDQSGWTDMELSHRIEFIQRTDLGVFSVHAMQILNEESSHRIVPGRVTEIHTDSQGFCLELRYGDRSFQKSYDQVILATGFDQVRLLHSLLSKTAIQTLESQIGAPLSQWDLSHRIEEDLSIEGVEPRLHLPMLAGLSQGPGFANLSCLGSLSDRVVLSPLKSDMKAQTYELQLSIRR
jgi:mycobactin lysine-N-oxygenase